MYFFLLDAIMNPYQEQLSALAEEQQICTTLVTHPEQSQQIQALAFRIDPLLLQRDYMRVTNLPGGILCSQKMLALLPRSNDQFSAIPTLLHEKESGQVLSPMEPYYFGVIHRQDEVIDWEHSESWMDEEAEYGSHFMTKLVLAEICEQNRLQIFRVEHTPLIVVHEHLQLKLEREKLIGIAFAPLNAVYAPYQGIQQFKIERLLRKQPNHANRWCELAAIHVSLYRFQEALVALNQALSLAPDLGKAWYLQGVAFHRLGRYQEALESYQKAVVHNESSAWIQVSALLRRLGRPEEALAVIEQQKGSLWEKGRVFWVELGSTYSMLQRYEDALGAFECALPLSGSSRDAAYCGKGEALYQLKRYDEALATYQAGLDAHLTNLRDVHPQQRALWRGKRDTLRALSRREEATEAEQQLLTLEQERRGRMQMRPL